MSVLDPAFERKLQANTMPRHVVLAVSFSAFLTSLDTGAVNVILPLIRDAFGASVSKVQWVSLAELFVIGGLLLVFGRAGDQVGARVMYLAGLSVFLLGCILCAVAPSLTALVAFRACQGAGTAMVIANSPAVLARYVPAGRRGLAFGSKACCIYFGLIAGPVGGGVVTEQLGWRAVFWIQVPLALFGWILAWLFVPNERVSANRHRFDFVGAFAWICGLASLLWLIRYQEYPGMVYFVAAILLLVATATIAIERHNPGAFFPLSWFRCRVFSTSIISLFLAFIASQMLTFLLPFYLRHSRWQSVIVSGQLLALFGLARGLSSFVCGRWADRIRARLLEIPSMVLLALGLAMVSSGTRQADLRQLVFAVLIAGLGFGSFIAPNNKLIMDSMPPDGYGFAAGMTATSRTVGMAVGVAIAGTIVPQDVFPLSRVDLAFDVAAVLALAAGCVGVLGADIRRKQTNLRDETAVNN